MSNRENISIYYFTGTGNAKKIADWTCEFANKWAIDCQTIDISSLDFKNLQAFDPDKLIVIISPVHGFNYPKIVYAFIKQLPKGSNSVVLMNTRAGMKVARSVTPGLSGIAFLLASFLLKLKGYSIKGQIPFDMPSNWISVHPALKDEAIKFIYKKNYERLEKHCSKFFSGKTDFHANKDLIQDILLAPISLLYYLVGRFIFAKSYYASFACINCGLCVKSCPVSSIKLIYGRPYWTFTCESCMKCMNSCPKNAIETAHGLFVAVSVVGSFVTTVILQNIFGISESHWYIRLIPSTAVFFVLLWLLYRFQQQMLRNRLIAKAIALTSLTHYKFWGRYRSIPDDRWEKSPSDRIPH